MDDLRSKVRALHTSGMDADMVVDLIIDVVARGLGKLGGRPPRTGMGPTATSVQSGPARAFTPAATQASLGFEVNNRFVEENETSNPSVCGSESALVLSSPSGPSQRSVSDRRSDEPLPPGFGDFWALYPRRVGKADALKAWRKLAPPAEVVRVAVIWHVEAWDAENPPRPIEKIPHPATWLNARRWEDEKPAPRPVAPHPKDRAYVEAVQKPFPRRNAP